MTIASELEQTNYKTYEISYFTKDRFSFFVQGLEKYLEKLTEYRAVEVELNINNSELEEEISNVKKSLSFLNKKNKDNKDNHYIEFFGEQITEVTLRLWKAALIIERDSVLQRRLELIRDNKSVPKVVLDGIDKKISQFEESLQMGLFAKLEPLPLIVPVVNIGSPSDEKEENIEVVKTIKKKLRTEGLFIESRTQGEDIHLLIGKRDGTPEKAHVVIDAKTGDIRVEDNQQEPTDLISKVESILTLESGKKIKVTREAIEELISSQE